MFKNGGQAQSKKRVSLMLGCGCKETQTVLKTFDSKRDEKGFTNTIDLLRWLLRNDESE